MKREGERQKEKRERDKESKRERERDSDKKRPAISKLFFSSENVVTLILHILLKTVSRYI